MQERTTLDGTARWLCRFDNFQRAFILLRACVEDMGEREFTQLEKEGVIRRFGYTWELSWKVLKDYLEHKGIVLDTVTPAAVLREALAAKIIDRGDVWMRALDARSGISDTCDLKTFERIILEIRHYYLAILGELYLYLLQKQTEYPSGG
ncbi:MAG: HI0074 family nucleotidyltransferase substrate-binding subunit [Chlamydiia bacterium]